MTLHPGGPVFAGDTFADKRLVPSTEESEGPGTVPKTTGAPRSLKAPGPVPKTSGKVGGPSRRGVPGGSTRPDAPAGNVRCPAVGDAILQSSSERREPLTWPTSRTSWSAEATEERWRDGATVVREQNTLDHPEQDWRRHEAPPERSWP